MMPYSAYEDSRYRDLPAGPAYVQGIAQILQGIAAWSEAKKQREEEQRALAFNQRLQEAANRREQGQYERENIPMDIPVEEVAGTSPMGTFRTETMPAWQAQLPTTVKRMETTLERPRLNAEDYYKSAGLEEQIRSNKAQEAIARLRAASEGANGGFTAMQQYQIGQQHAEDANKAVDDFIAAQADISDQSDIKQANAAVSAEAALGTEYTSKIEPMEQTARGTTYREEAEWVMQQLLRDPGLSRAAKRYVQAAFVKYAAGKPSAATIGMKAPPTDPWADVTFGT